MLALIFALWLPWNWFWLPSVFSAPVNTDAQANCTNHLACAKSDGMIFISPDPDDWVICGGLKRVVIHELQHHLLFKSGLYYEPDWDGFCNVIAEMILYGDYDEHQRGTMRVMCDDPPELHADLPLLLDGEIPQELAPWYPWFNLGGSNARE